MRTAVALLVTFLAASSALWVYRSVHTQPALPKAVLAKFVAWKTQFGKLYATPQEDQYRLSVFATQVETVDRLNARYDAYLEKTGQAPLKEAMFALPADADLTTEEFTILRTGLRAPAAESIETVAVRDEEYEPSLGQTDTKYQTRIRNQGSCGSCWAFSAVASLEIFKKSFYYPINRVQADLSQQYLVDCSTVDNGCSGGWPANTYTWIASFDLTFESSYPYKGVRGYCRRSEVPLAKLAGNVVSKTLPWGINTAVRVTNAGVNAGLQVYASGFT